MEQKTLNVEWAMEIPLTGEQEELAENGEFLEQLKENCLDASKCLSWCVILVGLKIVEEDPRSEEFVKRMDVIQNLINALGKELED